MDNVEKASTVVARERCSSENGWKTCKLYLRRKPYVRRKQNSSKITLEHYVNNNCVVVLRENSVDKKKLYEQKIEIVLKLLRKENEADKITTYL